MRRRYTVRENPGLAGDSVMLAFRCPKPVAASLDELVAEGRPGIESRTDALQDAVVVWQLLEEHERATEQKG